MVDRQGVEFCRRAEHLPEVRQVDLIEVPVPSRPGSISPPELNHPLHKLEQDGQAGWTRHFDEFTKWILVATCDDGTTGLESSGEFGLRSWSPSRARCWDAQSSSCDGLSCLSLDAGNMTRLRSWSRPSRQTCPPTRLPVARRRGLSRGCGPGRRPPP